MINTAHTHKHINNMRQCLVWNILSCVAIFVVTIYACMWLCERMLFWVCVYVRASVSVCWGYMYEWCVCVCVCVAYMCVPLYLCVGGICMSGVCVWVCGSCVMGCAYVRCVYEHAFVRVQLHVNYHSACEVCVCVLWVMCNVCWGFKYKCCVWAFVWRLCGGLCNYMYIAMVRVKTSPIQLFLIPTSAPRLV